MEYCREAPAGSSDEARPRGCLLPGAGQLTSASHVHAVEEGGRVILLDINRGAYFGLNELGSSIWLCIEENGSLGALLDRVASNTGRDLGRVKGDAMAYIDSLLDLGLLDPNG